MILTIDPNFQLNIQAARKKLGCEQPATSNQWIRPSRFSCHDRNNISQGVIFVVLSFMAGQPTPPNVPPPEIAGLIKGLLTIDFP